MLPDLTLCRRLRNLQRPYRAVANLLLAISAVFCIATGAASAQTAAPAVASADPAKYLDDIKALTAPEMEGRGDGSKGLTLAEHLLVARYKALGLEPGGKKDYLQSFRVVTGRRIQPGTKMSAHVKIGRAHV